MRAGGRTGRENKTQTALCEAVTQNLTADAFIYNFKPKRGRTNKGRKELILARCFISQVVSPRPPAVGAGDKKSNSFAHFALMSLNFEK